MSRLLNSLARRAATVGVGTLDGSVPLARRNLLADRRRLGRSAAGIAFAVLLMMTELGFLNGYIDSMLLMIRQLDGEILLVNGAAYQFERVAPFPRRHLYAARGIDGVASVRPFYIERIRGIWKNPQNHKLFAVLTFAFDPDQPVLLLPEVSAQLDRLRKPYAIITDQHSRENLGQATSGTETELAGRSVRVVGTFWLGPNFFNDGNLLMSDQTFFNLFGGSGPDGTDLPDAAVGVVKVRPGYKIQSVQRSLRAALPNDVAVLTKEDLIEQEAQLHAKLSPVGPIFVVGTIVGFVVGMLISYQILFTELSDQLRQYATLKAMGYRNRYLVRVVLQQAVFYAMVGYVPAWLLCFVLFKLVAKIAVGPMEVTTSLTVTTLSLTVAMCVVSALVAVRRVIATDPADLF